MKKSLLALAVLGAFAGAASAQTNVTLYGIVDVGVLSVDEGDERVTGLESGMNAASRIGFRGVEDLGGGLKASFVLENGFDSDTGLNAREDSAFGRLSYIGLGGGFGEVRLGRQNSPYKTALDIIDPFGGGGIAAAIDYINFVPTAAAGLAGGAFDEAGLVGTAGFNPERVSNTITYITPNFGGVTASVGYTFGETEGFSNNRAWYGQVGYANGPLAVQFAATDANTFDDEAGAFDAETRNLLLGATYDFGVAKLHAGFQHTKIEEEVTGADLTGRSALVGVTVPFGASKIRASYIHNDARDVDDADSQALALSYTYSLSKRTTAYATYVRTRNDDFADLAVGGGAAADAGESTDAIAVGIQHNF